jgi:peptidyl-prolyl cis-trans isomerase D
VRLAILCLVLLACGPGVPGGPTMNNRVNPEPQATGPAIQSNDILTRDARANQARVKHVLISWKDKDPEEGTPAASRTRAQADELAVSVLERVRAGDPIEGLMAAHSDDPGSARTGEAYEVTPSAGLVFEFKRLSLRLDVGEAGLVLSDFGWHVIQRIE